VERDGISEREARRRIQAVESDRRAFLLKHFHAEFAAPAEFDLVVNPEVLGIEGCIACVRAAVAALPERSTRDALNRSLANLPELLTSAVATPHFREVGNGQSIIEGFELDSIKAASAVDQLGLQNGDVVMEVNGDKLVSAASVLRLFGQAQAMSQAKLTVLRNGQRMTIVVNVK
jgi:membrane-associated protease RseP (regulator of RpoE activity)